MRFILTLMIIVGNIIGYSMVILLPLAPIVAAALIGNELVCIFFTLTYILWIPIYVMIIEWWDGIVLDMRRERHSL